MRGVRIESLDGWGPERHLVARHRSVGWGGGLERLDSAVLG